MMFMFRSAIQRVVSVKIKLAVYKLRSLNVKVLMDTILQEQNLLANLDLING